MKAIQQIFEDAVNNFLKEQGTNLCYINFNISAFIKTIRTDLLFQNFMEENDNYEQDLYITYQEYMYDYMFLENYQEDVNYIITDFIENNRINKEAINNVAYDVSYLIPLFILYLKVNKPKQTYSDFGRNTKKDINNTLSEKQKIIKKITEKMEYFNIPYNQLILNDMNQEKVDGLKLLEHNIFIYNSDIFNINNYQY